MKEKNIFLRALGLAEDVVSVSAFVIMCFVVLWSVICRYVLHLQFGYGEEMARYFMIYAIFVGISIGVRKEAHLGVEAFTNFLPEKVRKVVLAFSKVLCCAIYLLLTILAVQLVLKLASTTQKSPAQHLPMWLPYMAMPIGLGLSTLRSGEIAFLAVTGKENKDKEEVDV